MYQDEKDEKYEIFKMDHHREGKSFECY